jgi:nitrogen regulatory protein PII
MKKAKVSKITCEINRNYTFELEKKLNEIGITEFHIQAARSIVLREKISFFGFVSKTKLDEDPLDIIQFYVDPGNEEFVMSYIINKLNLNLPGKGTIFSEEIEVLQEKNECINHIKTGQIENYSPLKNLAGVVCIVQRGNANAIVRNTLNLGYPVPAIAYGIGTGLRDKLGLLRITVPAEKEIIKIVVNKHDLDDIINILIEAGKIDEPGKGFLYIYPIKEGIVNGKIYRGKAKSSASLEQIISALDDLKGNAEWRKRENYKGKADKHTQFLKNLVDMTIICNEGRSSDFIKAAMSSGAAGATIGKLSYINMKNDIKSKILHARETANMVVSKIQMDTIIKAVISEGLFDENSHGYIEIKQSPLACTYIGSGR